MNDIFYLSDTKYLMTCSMFRKIIMQNSRKMFNFIILGKLDITLIGNK